MSARRAALAVVAALLAGIWLLAAVVAPGYTSAIALALAWLLIVGIAVARVTSARPELGRAVGGAFAACALLLLAGFWWTCLRDRVVDEQIVTAPPDSRARSGIAAAGPGNRVVAPPKVLTVLLGRLRARAPTAEGTARVVRLADGRRRLTLSDGFHVSRAPGTHVRLATSAAGDRFRDLGGLKGNRGDQQYDIPAGLALSVYDTLVLYCKPFSQVLATAELAPA